MRRKNEITIVRVTPEGPLLVRGPLRLLDEQGNEVSIRRKVNALCRCGRSATQPFCDGTHKIVPFSPRAARGASASARASGSPPDR
ncbi:MAG: CDGSH iron-sulfur domain-containing protein [Actinobacteria bacterium]|nr:CDGSH iron-sulfur domain-containing protein [Actinomycetota bacterium]